MRKEILYAIVAGALFGLVIAFGIWKANNTTKSTQNETTQLPQSTDTSPSPQPVATGITIAKPADNQVITTELVNISGVTSANSFVIISGSGDYLVRSDEKGFFEEDIKLTSGINIITAFSIQKSGDTSKTSIILVYSSNFEVKTNIEEASKESTESADSVRKMVENKINEAKSTPTSYIGTVTDISKSTIEIRKFTINSDGKAGEIQQIATSEKTVYIKDGDSTKEIKLTDIAIGDFIVAMGYKNGNDVLATSRILVTNIPPAQSINTILGKIENITNTSLTATVLPGSETQSFKIDKNTDLFSQEIKKVTVTSFVEGDYAIFLTNLDEDKNVITRSVFSVSLVANQNLSTSPSPVSD